MLVIGAAICFLSMSAFICGKGKNTAYLPDTVAVASLQHQIDSVKNAPKDTIRLPILLKRYFAVSDTVRDSVFFTTKINLCDSLISAYESELKNSDGARITLVRLYEEKIGRLQQYRDSLIGQLNKPSITAEFKKIFQYDISVSIGTGLGETFLRGNGSVRLDRYEIGLEPSLSYVNSKINPALSGVFSIHF